MVWAPEAAVFLVVWLALMGLGRTRMFRDPGTLWHTVVGERILRTGDLPQRDTFTFTHQGQPWIAQQWLGECIMAWVHRLAGLDGLLNLSAAVIAAAFAIVASGLWRREQGGRSKRSGSIRAAFLES